MLHTNGVDFMKDSTESTLHHSKCHVLGVQVSALNMQTALDLSERLIESRQRGYVCVTGVHGVMEAQSDDQFKQILNRSFMNVPDGQPMTWVGKLQGHRSMSRVYGPDFMINLCERSVDRNYRHFLYGGNDGVAELLKEKLVSRFPGLNIVGTYTPPFRPLYPAEEEKLKTLLSELKPDVMWIGLSTPKQERFMSHYSSNLGVPLMVGVGAAFDINSGRTKDAPGWMKQSGLQWLHRLLQEPRRLAKRYLINNPKFLVLITLQFFGKKFATGERSM